MHQTNLKNDKPEEIHAWTDHNQSAAQGRQNILKVARGKQCMIYKGTKMHMAGFLIWNHGDQWKQRIFLFFSG